MVSDQVQPSNLQTDAGLLKEYSGNGSHSAFAALVERHGPMVHAVAMRILSNHHDAQDVTQATFLVLAREAEGLGRNPSVAGWLHTVSRRLSLDAHRSRESRQRREAAAMNEPVNLTRDAISTGFRRELDAALDALPERYRHPLVLFHLEGASLDEVARRLDLQPSTLRTRLSRARDMLRHILVRRGVEVASVAALSGYFAAEAKAAALTPSLLSSVVASATSNGVGVSANVLQLAGKAAFATKPFFITTSISSLAILMKTKAALVIGILFVLAALGTTAYVVNHGNTGTQTGADHGNIAAQTEGLEGKTRKRAPRFQSIEEAEQALIDFDLAPIFGSDLEEAKRCSYRLRSLSAKIPSVYFSELAARFRKGSESNLKDYFRQMALYMEWGRLDFEAALADLPRIDNARMHSKALERVFLGATESDPKAAMKRAETLVLAAPHELGDPARISLMDAIFDAWIESDPFSAVEWARQAQVPETRRNQWIDDGLRTWSQKDPDAAERWRKHQDLQGIGR